MEYLNSVRRGFRPCNSSALLSSGPEYLARAILFSHYDAEGRHPGYWYIQLDGGLYWVEENLMMVAYGRIAKVNYTDAIYSFVFDGALYVGSQRFSA